MAKMNYEHVYAAAGFSGESWDVAQGYNLATFNATAGETTFAATGKSITLSTSSFPAWFTVGKQFVVSGSVSNNGTFTVASYSASVITVQETLVNETPVGAVSFDGDGDTLIQDVLLKAGSGALTTDAPLVLVSTGALGAARQLDISALEAESAGQGGEALRGRLLVLSVQNTDLLTNNLTVVSSSTINGAASLVISSAGEYLLYHIESGVWRATVLPTPADGLATITRISFSAADWDAGATKNTIKILQTGSPAAGEVGPHELTIAGSYVIQVINTDLTPDEMVDVEIQFAANGDITMKKAARAADFNGTVVIIGSLD